MELFLIYLWLKLDLFTEGLHVVAVGCIVVWAFVWICRGIESIHPHTYPQHAALFKWHKRFVWFGMVLLFISGALPTSKDVAILVGSAIAIDMAKSPEGQKIGSLIRGKANEFLDAELKKLQPQPTK